MVNATFSPGSHDILWLERYSQEAPDFVSENRVIFDTLELVLDATNNNGIITADRGFDDKKFMHRILDRHEKRLRQIGNRNVIVEEDGEKKTFLLDSLVEKMALPYKKRLKTEESGWVTIRYGYKAVKLPGRDERLNLVVSKINKKLKGMGKEAEEWYSDPLILLTSCTVRRECEARRVLERYFLRKKKKK